ncbi:9867_t:CDS:2, partial [Scutellospora calospora]
PVNFKEKNFENDPNYNEKCEVLDGPVINVSNSNDIHANNDPKNWPSKKKWFILSIVVVSGMLSPIASTILYPAMLTLRQELNTTEIVVNSLISMFIFCMGIANYELLAGLKRAIENSSPIVWAAYSDEFATRRKVYLASLMVFIISTIICAVAKSIWLLMIMRAIQACGSSAVLSIGAGIISDIYDPIERGNAYGIFYLAYWIGPFLGPMCGGYLTEFLGWRWMFWFLAIYG